MTTSISWSPEQILAFAPDAQVGKAAQGLARSVKWQALGSDDRAVWGEQKGSGSSPYQVAVDLAGPAFKCSCPSRKRPCKHAVGLFLLAQGSPSALAPAAPPEWVQAWLAGRTAAEAKQTRPSETPADPKAQARRAARREKRVEQGAAVLGQWLEDLVRQGLGSLPAQPPTFWETQAARLVDAQAPGLARRVRELAAIPLSGENWPARMFYHLARLYLLLEAFNRIDSLPAELQAEIRTQVGWLQSQDDLRGQPGARDCWLVVGQRFSEEDKLRVRRTWLWCHAAGRAALLLDFAVPGQAFEGGLAPGAALEAELVFWPGPFPQRALVKEQGPARPLDHLPGYTTLEAGLAAYSAALALTPWLDSFLLPLENVTPIRQADGWAVRDAAGQQLSLSAAANDGWRLLALSGGRPLTLAGEWDGAVFSPLSVWVGGEFVLIEDRSE